jgi:hypothetical protein
LIEPLLFFRSGAVFGGIECSLSNFTQSSKTKIVHQ